MFYEGDLQSGIAKAVQEAKLVGCFVTDEGEESRFWENDFLQEDSLKSALSEQTVLLRLLAGSQEAGYLAAIFPLPKTPTFVLIKDGELKEYLAAGVSKEDFLKRLGAVFEARDPAQTSPTFPSTSQQPTTQAPTPIVAAEVATSSSSSSSSPTPQQPPTSTPSRVEQQTAHLQSVLAERSARLEKQKKEQEAAEKAKRAAESKARREAAEQANPKSAADQKYAQQQRQRQQEAREERARILKRVEDDKAERREAAAARKAEREGKKDVVESTGESSGAPSKVSMAKECAVQVRLFDGSTIRSRFPSSGTLLKDIRPWVDGKQEGDVPYTFKQVLSPLPNKNIETSEEERTLQALGLTPSATLILIPVSGYISAYEGNTGVISRAVSGGYGLVSSGLGLITGVLGSFLGGTPAAPAPQAPEPTSAQPSASINVRTLRDQEPKKDDQQFYNGNALNFEPRKDDKGKDD